MALLSVTGPAPGLQSLPLTPLYPRSPHLMNRRVPRLLRLAAQVVAGSLLVLTVSVLLLPKLLGWNVETVLSSSMD